MMDTRRKAVFFDRDGVLNEDDGYVHQMRKLRWVKGAREIVAELTKAGFLLFVVTNQSGVARGYFTEETVRQLHREMNEEFQKWGGHITEFFYCPHLPGAPLPAHSFYPQCEEGETLFLQGIMDCLVEEADGLTIIDYKTDHGDMFQWALDVTWWPAWLPTELKESENADDDIIDEK